jgi:D-alanine-D-alanine ligase
MQLFELDQRLLVHTSTREIQENIAQAKPVLWSDLPQLVDFVFIGLHGGKGEDGTVQGALEMLKLPYNGSGVFASALCMDKYKTGQFLRKEGFATPDAWLVEKSLWILEREKVMQKIQEQFGFPCIIKPHDDGCSVMVYKVESEADVALALTEIFAQKQYALVEELLVGMELTVGVMGNDVAHALAPSQSIAKKGILSSEEKFLPGAGENQTPALLPVDDIDFVRRELERVYTAIGCKGYVRIDCFFQTALQSKTGKRRLVILEINSLPALTPATCLFAQAAEEGMRPMEFLDKVIQLGMQLHVHAQTVSVDAALEQQAKLY